MAKGSPAQEQRTPLIRVAMGVTVMKIHFQARAGCCFCLGQFRRGLKPQATGALSKSLDLPGAQFPPLQNVGSNYLLGLGVVNRNNTCKAPTEGTQ